MAKSDSLPSPSAAVEAAAAQGLARHDRGLSEAEQTAYGAWLQEDAGHAIAVARLERTWEALDRLAVDPAFQASPPNPDLLAPPRRRVTWLWVPLLAAAAAIAFVFFPAAPKPVAPNAQRVVIHPAPERLELADGSVVELNQGAKLEVTFTPAERRVRLVRGEAYFTVAHNPARPFIVSANQVAVRAVGTAFSVGLASREISVLVTEGRVRVDEMLLPSGEKSAAPRELSALGAGQQRHHRLRGGWCGSGARRHHRVGGIPRRGAERALSWRGLRLEFADTPLSEVAAEFNRYNRRKLVVHDAATGAIRVGGNFRADNVDAFIRLLDVGFGVSAFPASGEIILRKTHGN